MHALGALFGFRTPRFFLRGSCVGLRCPRGPNQHCFGHEKAKFRSKGSLLLSKIALRRP